MLHHVSFAVEDPQRVAGILADLVGGTTAPFEPLAEACVVWAGDGAGTAFEIYPRGTELWPDSDGGAAHFGRNALGQPASATHAAISVDRTEAEILAAADRAGWQAGRLDRGGFDVIELWVENQVMLEILTPAMLTDYLGAVNAPQIAASGEDFEPLAFSVQIPTDPESVWQAWTVPDQLREWWGVASARVDVRIGGAYELIFRPDAPAGTRGSEQCRILSYVPGRMLSFTWNTPSHLPVPRTHTWVVLSIAEAGGGTAVQLVHNGLLTGPGWDECRQYFRHAWRRVLHRLAVHNTSIDLRTVVPAELADVSSRREASPAPS